MDSLYTYCICVLQNLLIIPKEIIMLIVSMMLDDLKVYCGRMCTYFSIDNNIYVHDQKNQIFSGKKIDSIHCGLGHTIFIEKFNKAIYSWGDNNDGQLGLGDRKDRATPHKIIFDFESEIISVTCGGNHTFVITKSDKAYSWGYNIDGQLGLGDYKHRNFPHKLPIENVKSISCGLDHTIILTENGCFGCGKNSDGQLGLGYIHKQNSLQKINEILNPISISCGSFHTVTLTMDGCYSWGYNSRGQLGLGDDINRDTPNKIYLLGLSVTSISCGSSHTMILTKQCELFACGSNFYGQSGLGAYLSNFKFQKINLNESIMSVQCRYYHTIIITKSRKYYGCGNNEYGQLGLGPRDTNPRYVFTEIQINK